MKIKALRLVAYGPFTDAAIDFGDSGSDFHMLFGPNEAGKSSALRALRNMLFGIPARAPDNFLHAYPNLRVGATLVKNDGHEIDFLRRKGHTKTLRSGNDESVLDDDALVPFLGGIGQSVFEQMFAIGHDDLVQGGEEIISGKGRVGEALFAAGAGLIRLQAVQQDLEKECGSLFKPSGSTPRINQRMASLKAVRKSQKEALLQAKTWQTHHRALEDAQRRMQKALESLGQIKQKVAKLERIRAALPLIARKKELDAELVGFQNVPDLPDDFGDKRRDAERELKIATRDLERCRQNIAKIDRRIEALPVPETMIQQAAAIEALQHDLGSFRKAQKDRPGLEARMRTFRKQATDKLAEIDAASALSAENLSLPPSVVGEIQDLGKKFERLTANLETAEAQHRKLRHGCSRLAEQRKAMPAAAEVSGLDAALQPVQAAGPIEKRLAEMQATVEALESELTRSLKRQSLWGGPLAEIDALPCPSPESIDRFEERFDTWRRRIEKQREKRVAAESEITQTQTELQALDGSQRVPSESNLNDARSLRDRGWGLIRDTLEGHAPNSSAADAFVGSFEGAGSLPDAFEESTTRADHLADRLRREAEQVSRKGLLEARKKHHQASLIGIAKALEKEVGERAGLDAEWQALWKPSGITPLSPKEMRAWLSDIASMRERLSVLRSDKTRFATTNTELTVLKSELLEALEQAGAPRAKAGVSLLRLIEIARTHATTQRDLQSRIAAADKDLFNLTGEKATVADTVADLKNALGEWKTDWQRKLRKIGLNADAGPSAALAVIESIREARNQINEADVLGKRIDGIDRDSAVFETRVGELVTALAPDLDAEPRDRAAELLNARLTTARKSDSKRQTLNEQLAAATKEKQEAEKRIHQSSALIEALCQEADCRGVEALAEMEKLAQTRKDRIREQDDLQERLRGLGAGATVEEFIADASSVEADGIGSQLEQMADEIEELERGRSELDQAIGTEKTELKRMDGSARAADHAEQAERLLAGLESDVGKYARVKLAAVILSRAVEQYREKHQGPLILRASELFARMTLGAFNRLRAEYDERGNPVLVGIRPHGGAQVKVEGMSDGTADQLYLALRLASLEQYLQNNEPLPFVVDDILLRFDDHRSAATLKVLAELSQKTQVIFFTHHQHLVDLAQNSVDPDILRQHVLA